MWQGRKDELLVQIQQAGVLVNRSALFFAASYEERASTIPSCLLGAVRASAYTIRPSSAEMYITQLQASISSATGDLPVGLRLEPGDGVQYGMELWSFLEVCQRQGIQNFLVDASCLNREALPIVLKILWSRGLLDRTFVLYNLAADYSVGDSPSRKWLSRGHDRLIEVAGFWSSSEAVSSRRVVLAFAGLEISRLHSAVADLEPDALWIAIPSQGAVNTEIDAIVAERANVLRFLFPNVEIVPFDPMDARSSFDLVRMTVAKESDSAVTVLTMSTKLSTVGAALGCLGSPRLSLQYAKPLIYNSSAYSKPSDSCVLLPLSGFARDITGAGVETAELP